MHRTVLRDPGTGLECAIDLNEYKDFPVLEWALHFKNTGTQDTPILEDIQALDAAWATTAEPRLGRSRGSQCGLDDFLYSVEPLGMDTPVRMTAGGGRSSNNWLPFFNLQCGNTGLIIAIGWTGQWAAEFTRVGDDAIRMRAGMELTHLTLHPGEAIRTPRIVALFRDGDTIDAHNLLRRFILAHHTPRVNGDLLQAPICAATWGGMKSSHHLDRVALIKKKKLPYDYYWIDAGWYGPADSYSPDEFVGDWAKHVGNWAVNPAAHPKGLRSISDAAHAAGMKFLLWFEPERAIEGTPLTVEHPEWFLSTLNPNRLFNLGIPAARAWLTDFISGLITEHGVDGYRQDFNMEPLPFWRSADAPDRQGMTEIRHIEGLYTFWDDLLRRHPGLLIDNCASGGRRIDIELTGRSIPLWRSDWQCPPTFDPVGSQVQGMGLSYWVPLSATGTHMRPGDTYNFRSALSAGVVFSLFAYERNVITADYPWAWHRKMMADHQRARPCFYGDYYPLTACSTAPDTWAAYQMHRPDLQEGLMLAFRRDASPFTAAEFKLRGLTPQTTYLLEDADTGRIRQAKGDVLMEQGVPVTMAKPRDSRLIFYRCKRA